MFDTSVPFWNPVGTRLGEMKAEDWSSLNDILLTSGLLKEKVPLNQVINYDVLRDAYQGIK
jgi:hypothetical protein